MDEFLTGAAAGLILGVALGWRGLLALAGLGIAATVARGAGVDLAALWLWLTEQWTVMLSRSWRP